MQYHICDTSQQLAAVAAAKIRDLAMAAIHASGRFAIALTGGKTPEETYRYLAAHFAEEDHWAHWAIFVGDDRHVPTDHPMSNFGMGQRLLLDHVTVGQTNLFPVPTHLPTAAQAAEEYQNTIIRFFQPHPCIFDLILLGVGDDGHTASLFPGAPALNSTSLVTWSPAGTLPPPIDRITFTFPLINAARHVMILAAGERKKQVVTDILDRKKTVAECPSLGVNPYPGDLLLYVDRAAAAG